MLDSVLVQGVILLCASLIFWRLAREFIVKSSLDLIPGPPAASFLTGHMQDLFNASAWKYHDDISKRYGSIIKIKALLGERQLIVSDPKALQHILVKDQSFYEQSDAFITVNKLLFGEGLLATIGEQHRKQRKLPNPVFSIAHMREMTPIFYQVTRRLREVIFNQINSSPKEIDILHWMSRTALELIGQSGMGYSFDSLDGSSEATDQHPYSQAVNRVGGAVAGPLASLLAFYVLPVVDRVRLPKVKRWIVDHWPSQWIQDIKSAIDVIHETALEIYRAKQKSIEEGHVKANVSAAEEDKLTDEEVYGQIATLTFAAMDTTSSALSRILSLLAEHPEIQDKLRAELIEAIKINGSQELGYDQLVSLPYLDAVCRETLRLYPPVSYTNRVAGKNMILPLFTPIKTTIGEEITELVIPQGTTIHISIIGANRNPKIWGTDSHEWKPERWLNPLPENVKEAHIPGVYSHLMTFIGGSRACIGFKFSQLEMKVVLSVLLTSFKFEHTNKKIIWKMSGIAAPLVEGDDYSHPTMPMMIGLVNKRM